jgi:hypothetical protein
MAEPPVTPAKFNLPWSPSLPDMGRRLRINGKIDYLTDPRLSKLTFASIQKHIGVEATCVSRGLPTVELKQKLFGCATKFALVSVADEFEVELDVASRDACPYLHVCVNRGARVPRASD